MHMNEDTHPLPVVESLPSARRFVDVTGRKLALLGHEDGRFECWMWPIKVFREWSVAFRVPGRDQPVSGAATATRVAVSPHGLTIVHGHQDFTVRQTVHVARDQRLAVFFFVVDSPHDIEIEVTLRPEMRAMWPAAIGAPLVRRDEETMALLLTEELGRFAMLIGGPDVQGGIDVDHGLPSQDLTLRMAAGRQRCAQGPLHLVLAGGETLPDPLADEAKRGLRGAAGGHARLEKVTRLAREVFRAALERPADLAVKLERHWRRFLVRSARLRTPEPRLDEAFLHAKIAIEKAWVEVDGLGFGMVAGLACSGATDRPGFGWFFDGDAMIGGNALAACGHFDAAKRVLEFAASHQAADGKIMHELTLSAQLCRWTEDYPYAYYKAENTPAFLIALERYAGWSNDRACLESLRPAALKCAQWIMARLDKSGAFDTKDAGLGAVEAGPLCGRLAREIYMQGFAAAGLRAFVRVETILAKEKVDGAMRAVADRAAEALEAYWSEERGHYGFGRSTDGERFDDLSGYLGLPLSLGLGQVDRARRSAAALNRPEVMSDWGSRMFSVKSPVYDPAHYNTGSVFPYLTNFTTLALYRTGLPAAAFQVLESQFALSGFEGHGLIPEHFVGDRCVTPERGVPHQVFSSAALVDSTLHGLFGVDPEAWQRSVTLRPALPPHWDRMELQHATVGDTTFDMHVERRRAAGRSRLEVRLERRSGPPISVRFEPVLPALSRVLAARCDDDEQVSPQVKQRGATMTVVVKTRRLEKSLAFAIESEDGPAVVLPAFPPVAGESSRALRVTDTRLDKDSVTWTFAGLAGQSYGVPFFCGRKGRLTGAELGADGKILVTLPQVAGASGSASFVTRDVTADVS